MNNREFEISKMFRRIAKAERHLKKGVRVEEETSRISRLKDILRSIGVTVK